MRYKQCKIDGKMRYVHRVVWEEANGQIPSDMEVDHINGDSLDNNLSNLRLVTRSENQHNSKAKGFCLDKRSGKYLARIRADGKERHIGLYETEEEAKIAYLEAKKVYHPTVPEEYYGRV